MIISSEIFPTTEDKIAGITQPNIIQYFKTLNAGEYTETAALFAQDGVMYPPFEFGIVGRSAIAFYLEQEAQDTEAEPHQGITTELENNHIQIQVIGKAKTSWFSVNVMWWFILNPQRQILEAKIELLASPQELLTLQPSQVCSL